jgi:glycosyltransferase involved in cell wall biosynthesis
VKILLLTHSFYPVIGGIESNSEILAHFFVEAGEEVHLLTWCEDATNKPFPFDVIRNPSTLTLLKEFAWAEVVFENNPCMRLGWPNLIFNKPSVIALNTWISRIDGNIGLIDKIKLLWLKKASKIIAVSNAIRLGCFPGATVIPNPYDTNNFKIIDGIDKTINFVFLGRLVSDKGVDMAIRAIKCLLDEGVFGEVKPGEKLLTIIGDGVEKYILEDLTSALDLNNYIDFKGQMRGLPLTECLNRHKYNLIPSTWEEPFGNVVLEGMACGCLPIASDGGGLPDAIGNAGLTFPRGDLKGFVNTLKHLIQNPELEIALRSEINKHLARHYPEEVSRQYLSVLRSCLKVKADGN